MAKSTKSYIEYYNGVCRRRVYRYGLYSFWEYKKYPELYAMRSAPWYINILVYGIFAATVLILGIVLKLAIRKSMGK